MILEFYKTIKIKNTPFYEEFPYSGRGKIYSVDSRGAYCDESNFFYNRIPKVANSTISSELLFLSTGEKNNSKESKLSFISPSAMNSRQVAAMSSAFKFVFVRNPYTRILSSYLDKVVRRGYLSEGGKVKTSLFRNSSVQPTFSEFCKYLENGGLYDNAHWTPQSDLLLLPLNKFDFVGKFETLAFDLQKVLKILFPFSESKEFDHLGPPKTNSSTLVDKYYCSEDFLLIKRLYKNDFDLFDYSYIHN